MQMYVSYIKNRISVLDKQIAEMKTRLDNILYSELRIDNKEFAQNVIPEITKIQKLINERATFIEIINLYEDIKNMEDKAYEN